MMTFWPSAFSISAAVTRVTWSVDPPAAHGTMIVMGFVGFHVACASAGAAIVDGKDGGRACGEPAAFAAVHGTPPCSVFVTSAGRRRVFRAGPALRLLHCCLLSCLLTRFAR